MIRLTLLDKCEKDVKSSTNANAIYWMNGMNENGYLLSRIDVDLTNRKM